MSFRNESAPRAATGAAALLFSALAACTPMRTAAVPPAPVGLENALPGPAAANSIGQGPTRIALLVPLSAPGAPGAAARALRNAAELAYNEGNSTHLQILVRDTGGTPQGAATAAAEAVREGAGLILGPLTAPDVAAAGEVARNSQVNLVAFSTDPNVAGRGVYLLSFQADPEINRVVAHAAHAGKRAFAAIVPDSPYGALASATFQQAVPANGGRVVALEKAGSDPSSRQAAAQRIADVVRSGGADALFLPEAGPNLKATLDVLAANGVDGRNVKFLGTGVWNDPATLGDARLQGGWFAGPDPAKYRDFAGRYRHAYGADPVRIASLAYDATRLAAELARRGANFSSDTLASPSGFAGTDGVFRFRREGTVERGLAVLEVQNGTAQPVSPAPDAFP